MLKRFTNLIILILTALIIYSCDNDDFVSPYDITSPVSQPSNLQITQESVSSVRLTWEDNSLGEEGFKISRKKDNQDWVEEYAVLGENIEEFVDNEYEISSDYSYRVFSYYNEINSNYIGISKFRKFILVPGGTYTMGDTREEGSTNEQPTHQVTLSSFYIGKYEVTQAEYQALVANNPADNYGVGSNYPVYYVTWYDAVQYCNARSIEEGLTPCYNTTNWACDFSANGYRLPTEAEWEYASRGASNDPDYLYSGSNDLNSVAWYTSNSGSATHNVGTKTPNSLGIYDMSGNVYEWCNDWFGAYSSSVQNNPEGPTTGSYRVSRGGSWNRSATFCRLAFRFIINPTFSSDNIGFRLARSSE